MLPAKTQLLPTPHLLILPRPTSFHRDAALLARYHTFLVGWKNHQHRREISPEAFGSGAGDAMKAESNGAAP